MARFSHDFVVPTGRRGLVPVGPVRTVRADPVGLVHKELIWADEALLRVHPRTISIPSMSTGLIRDLEGNPTRDLTTCLLYTSDAADDLLCVDLGGRRII